MIINIILAILCFPITVVAGIISAFTYVDFWTLFYILLVAAVIFGLFRNR